MLTFFSVWSCDGRGRWESWRIWHGSFVRKRYELVVSIWMTGSCTLFPFFSPADLYRGFFFLNHGIKLPPLYGMEWLLHWTSYQKTPSRGVSGSLIHSSRNPSKRTRYFPRSFDERESIKVARKARRKDFWSFTWSSWSSVPGRTSRRDAPVGNWTDPWVRPFVSDWWTFLTISLSPIAELFHHTKKLRKVCLGMSTNLDLKSFRMICGNWQMKTVSAKGDFHSLHLSLIQRYRGSLMLSKSARNPKIQIANLAKDGLFYKRGYLSCTIFSVMQLTHWSSNVEPTTWKGEWTHPSSLRHVWQTIGRVNSLKRDVIKERFPGQV